MEESRYYIAYGSNLNKEQMRFRCPGATPVGTGKIPDYELSFRGSKSGAYLTIEPKEGGIVPVAVWRVTPSDWESLDRYEGFPDFYQKASFNIDIEDTDGETRRVTAIAYVMREGRPNGVATWRYMDTCKKGYADFGFDERFLDDADSRAFRSVCGRVIPFERMQKGGRRNGEK